jgi:hypothetical protein
MRTTIEGQIKTRITKVLLAEKTYYFMPVQMGYGPAGLDYHCVALTKTGVPFPFFIEAKKPGGKLRPRQEILVDKLRKDYQCKVWVIDSEVDIRSLELWLQRIKDI